MGFITNINGFQVAKSDGRRFASIESDRLEAYMAYLRQHRDYGVHVSRVYGYRSENLDFLSVCDWISALYLQSSPPDIKAVHSLSTLNWLLVAEVTQSIDLGRFPHLEYFHGNLGVKMKNLAACQHLRVAMTWGYRGSRSRTMSDFPSLPRLEKLGLTQSPVKSLKGIERLESLEHVELNHTRRLRDVSSLAALADTLSAVELDSCKALDDLSALGRLHQLRVLKISRCGTIPSLHFIRSLSNLEHLSFVGSVVADGDLSVLLEIPHLKHVGFDDAPHYSHQYEEVNEVVSRRWP